MGVTKIEWCDFTFNPWRGCTKISPGCSNCYAETLSHRNPKVLGEWGNDGTRVIASEAAWREPLKWNRRYDKDLRFWHERPYTPKPERPRVFCASLADIFENRPELSAPRMRLFKLIGQTPHLDWLLLTKRPQVALENWPLWAGYWAAGRNVLEETKKLAGNFVLPNVWLGVSVEDQQRADERIPVLLKIPAKVRFLSIEPLLESINIRGHVLGFEAGNPAECVCGHGHGFTRCPNTGGIAQTCHYRGCLCPGFRRPVGDGIHWAIVGGESGGGSRPFMVSWARQLRDQCKATGVTFFLKQFGAKPMDVHECEDADRQHPLKLIDKKGGAISEWPEDLRIREFPQLTSGGPIQ